MNIKKFFCKLFGISNSKYKYGWRHDKKDHRDFIAKFGETFTAVDLPEKVDLRKSGFMPKVYDQKNCGSCTANSIGAALEFDRAKQGLDVWTPSRLFIYYYERSLEGSIHEDCGAAIRDGFKVINTIGYAKETTWPYDVSKFAVEPSEDAKNEGIIYKSVNYQSVPQTEHDIKSTLAQGYTISFGIQVFHSFESQEVAANGIVSMPSFYERSIGGHAILLVGYDQTTQRYIFRNSWGDRWGDDGYGYLPYDYVHSNKLSSDFWVVQTVNQ